VSKIIAIQIFLFTASVAYSQEDLFIRAVNKLHNIGYIEKEHIGTCEVITNSGFCCNIKPKDNWINKRIPSAVYMMKDSTVAYGFINYREIKQIRYYNFQANYSVQEKELYPRIRLEEWQCIDSLKARSILDVLQSYNWKLWEFLDKAPLLFWRKDDKIYFLTIGGFYCIDEFPKLKKNLKETFGQNTTFFQSYLSKL
jgi:hypothetical protein